MATYREYSFPDDLYYHKDHTWVRPAADGTVTIGMNEFYVKGAGDTTYIDLPFEGDEVSAGETIGKLQSVKWVGNLVAPLSGEILSVNEALEDDSTLVNTDPYGDGWILTMTPADLDGELAGLMHGSGLREWIEAEITRLDAETL
ncbi:glycine cleavage system protein GcvH [bacterium]|nr:glycine cleavage system protein GcvH [candidate division CSSED10-310 bacterium]